MAASAWKVYTAAKDAFLSSGLNLTSAALRMKVVISASGALVSNFARGTFASCGTAVSWANADAKTPGAVTVSKISANATTIMFDHSAVVFTASGTASNLRYLVLGLSGGAAIAWSKLSANTAVTAGNTLTVTPNASGIFTLTGGTT